MRICHGLLYIITHFLTFSKKIKVEIGKKHASLRKTTQVCPHKRRILGILCNRNIKPQVLYLYIPLRQTQEVFMTCCNQGNSTLWILIALLVLGSKDGIFCSNLFSGCGLPILVALLFCLYKNGTLSAILTPPCNCGCTC